MNIEIYFDKNHQNPKKEYLIFSFWFPFWGYAIDVQLTSKDFIFMANMDVFSKKMNERILRLDLSNLFPDKKDLKDRYLHYREHIVWIKNAYNLVTMKDLDYLQF